MSFHDYQESRRISSGDTPFYALIMAAMRQADTANLALLREAFPGTWAELEARHDAPGGALPGDREYGEIQARRRKLSGGMEMTDDGRALPGDEPVLLSYEEAVALLPDGDRVHTFLDAGGALVGADWDRADILRLLETSSRREVSGPAAQGFGHGLAVLRDDGVPVFIKTRPAS